MQLNHLKHSKLLNQGDEKYLTEHLSKVNIKLKLLNLDGDIRSILVKTYSMHYASALKFKLIYMYNIELKFDLYLYIFLMHVAHVFRMKETFIYLHIVLFFFFTLIRVLYPCELPIITLILARIIHFQNIVCFFLKTHS